MAEEMIPQIIESLYGMKAQYLENNAITASRINSRNSSIFWESERNIDFIYTFLKRKQEVEKNNDTELLRWIDYFEKDRQKQPELLVRMHKGIQESLREF
jgi:glyceraldehyde-3-phosphate dehydrogenase (ferredoxin)